MCKKELCKSIAFAAVYICVCNPVAADEPSAIHANTGKASLTMRFQYRGSIPKRQVIDSSKERFCAGKKIVDESLLVSKSLGIKNVVLTLYDRAHPEILNGDISKPQGSTVKIMYDGCRFTPRVLAIQTGQELLVENCDGIGHNTRVNFFANDAHGFLVPIGGNEKFQFLKSEPAILPIECSIHPWERAWAIVKDHPFVGISDAEGVLTINGLPPGKVVLRLWHESLDLKKLKHVSFPDKVEILERRKIAVAVKPGKNDFGTVTIDSSLFAH